MSQPSTSDTSTSLSFKARGRWERCTKTAPVVVVREAVLEAILEFSEQEQTRERGGFLLGGVYGDDPQYVVVRHFHPALEALGNSASLTFTHETWAALTRETERPISRPNRWSAGSTRIPASAFSCPATTCSSTRTFSPSRGRSRWSSIRGGRSLASSTGGAAR